MIAWMVIFASPLLAEADSTFVSDSLVVRHPEVRETPALEDHPEMASPRPIPSSNPNISVIGDFRASYTSPSRRNLNAEFREAEIALQSVVDPYARGDFFLSVARDEESGTFELELEEAYLTTLDFPADLLVKGGKFRSTFGRLNHLHPHAVPFVDVPSVYAHYLGDEGLNDEGFSVSWLVPNPLDFFQELTIEATRGPAESPSFVESDVDRFLYLAHLKNFWDLTDNATLELGFTGVHGPNEVAYSSTIAAVDITYKWKPLRFNRYRSFVLQAEALWSNKKISPTESVKSWGMYAFATYQPGQRWFLTGRFDYSNQPHDAFFVERAASATLGWYATEFQKVELQIKSTSSNVFPTVNQVLLRSVFVIGAHGAHRY